MYINLFNSANPNGKCIPVTITLNQLDDVASNDGEIFYTILLATGAIDKNKKRIDNVFLTNITEKSILNELNRGLAIIGSQIDWGILQNDTYPPIITSISPVDGTQNVPISSNIEIHITDPLPASFIDLSSLKLKVNGIDITNQISIKEANNEVRLLWVPIKLTN